MQQVIRLRTAVVAGSALLAAAAVVAAAVGFGGAGARPSPRATGPTLATIPVTRTTLTQTQQVSGSLNYGTPVRVIAHGGGTITWLPALGAVLRRGQPVYQVDYRPVSLFYGARPLYRSLRPGDSGADVKQVEQNLAALGYTGFTVDTSYTTATAVRDWQEDHSYPETGVFDQATVVLARTEVRIAAPAVQLADPARGAVFAGRSGLGASVLSGGRPACIRAGQRFRDRG